MQMGLEARARRMGRRIFPLGRRNRRGAALVMAVAILAIVIAIAVAFFSTSRVELNIATNVANTARADMMSNAGLAMAMAFLNHDLLAHSTYTSLDFAAFSYFDGSWVAGKRWAFPSGQSWRDRMHSPLLGHAPNLTNADLLVPPPSGTPYINLDALNSPLPYEAPQSPLFSGNSGRVDTSHWLYIPRLQAVNAALNYQDRWAVEPQYSDNVLVYRKQIIHGWADVDNDGDGFRDAMWIPVPADLIVGNRDVDGDGFIDLNGAADIQGDGIDNNLNNGHILNTNVAPNAAGVLTAIDDNLDGAANDGNDGVDEIGETAVFLYIGAADGLDNDGDGVIDNIEEGITADGRPVVWQTVPLPGVNTQAAIVNPARVAELISIATGVTVSNTNVAILVDQIDNDYDMIANNGFTLAFNLSDFPLATSRQDAVERLIPLADPRVKAMSQIAEGYTGAGRIVFAKGEPATEVIGRVAVLVKDAAAQVHLNTAGAHRFIENSANDPARGGTWGGPGDGALWPGGVTLATGSTAPAFNQGLGPHEYMTSAMPGVGPSTSRALWQDLVGAPNGLELAVTQAVVGQYDLDMVRPGYGGADDNGSALWMAMDGLDNDGDGLVDEGLNPAYPELLGQFEGIDEPGEFRNYRPQRNFFAENDGIDNDNDGLIDELGELGDANRRSEDAAMEVAGAIANAVIPSGPAQNAYLSTIRETVRDAGTIHSSDKDMRHQQRSAQVLNLFSGALNERGRIVSTPPTNRGITGLKLDFNYAAAPRIAEALRRDWAYDQPPTFLRLTGGAQYITGEQGYAAGLRSEGVQWFNDGAADSRFFPNAATAGSGLLSWPDQLIDPNQGPDRELRAAQLAANAQDYRDADSAQTRLTTAKNDDWWQSLTGTIDAVGIGDGERRPIVYTQAGAESIRINEIMVRPTRRVEAEMVWGENAAVVTNNLANNWSYDVRQNFDPDVAYPAPQVAYSEPLSGLPGAEFRVRQIFMAQLGAVDFRFDGGAIGGPRWQTPWQYFHAGGGFAADYAFNNVPAPTTYAMGGSAALMTTTPELPGSIPNAVMFEFRPSPSLPPGRYYLTLNTMLDTRIPYSATVLQDNQIRVWTKYVQNGAPGVLPSGARTGDTQLLVDIANGTAVALTDPVAGGRVVIGGPGGLSATNDDPEGGNLFVATTPARDNTAPAGYLQDTAYTIEIPPYSDATVDWRLQVAISFPTAGSGPISTDPPLKAINYFEFSQEPDHEWVEIVNIAEADASQPLDLQAIDLSGWELEVGTGGEVPRRYEIPEGTTIAPGGMLLLSANKSDRYDERSFDAVPNYRGPLGNFVDPDLALTGLGVFYRNGIGMAAHNGRNHAADAFDVAKTPYTQNESNVTSFPHFPPLDPNTGAPLGDDLSVGRFLNLFWRRTDIDLIDYTANGFHDDDTVQDQGFLLAHYISPLGVRAMRDDYIRSTPFDVSGYGSTGNAGDKAYDRVVQLISTELGDIRFDVNLGASPATVIEEIAEIVLRGGIFPNYPERDGIDNDGDSARVRGELANDRIDNDGDGLVDEAEEFGVDLNGNDDPSTLVGASRFATAFLFDLPEGVDEGRWPLGMPNAEPGSPAAQPGIGLQRPIYFPEVRAAGYGRLAKPASYSRQPYELLLPMPVGVDGPARDGLITNSATELIIPEGQPNAAAPPAWKAFVEKRMYPGDAVKVTLYVGSADTGRIADQISYTEQDVTNRSIHDGANCPQGALTYDGAAYGSASAALDTLNLTFWPADSMGLDFYRSLERRHPLWHGDLAGTTNRWQPTDGAYDDWDASRTPAQLAAAGNTWWDPAAPTAAQIQLFAHQFGGSPLRQNFWQRMTDNPSVNHDLNIAAGNDTRFNTQFGFDGTGPAMNVGYALSTFNPNSAFGLDLTDTTALSPYSPERRWTLTRAASIRNRSLASPADLVRMPAMTINRSVYSAADADLGGPFIDGLRSVLVGEGDGLDSVVSGGNIYAGVQSGNPDELTALVTTGASSPTVLSVAQADVLQLGIYGNRGVNWDFSDTVNGEAPFGWAPVFLFPIVNDGEGPSVVVPNFTLYAGRFAGQPFDLETQFLFNNTSGNNAADFVVRVPGTNNAQYTADLNERWGLRTRASMFVSGNLPGFSPFTPDHNNAANQAAEALFLWDGADGVENGEYDLYLVTAEPVDPLLRANAYRVNVLNGESMLSDFALNVLLPRAAQIDPAELPVDVEVFTDRNGNNTVLRDDVDLTTTIDPELALDRGQNPALGLGDSFGMQTGLTPGTDGVVHYGVVRVENNVLAVMIRNWADRGKINRFSRVVLTPRNKTRGRININTAAANPTDKEETGAEDFNATRGLPGLWMSYFSGNPFFVQPVYPYTSLGPVDANSTGGGTGQSAVTRILSKAIESGRQLPVPDAVNPPIQIDWIDGRYYRHPSDLFAFSQELELPNGGGSFATVKNWNTGILAGAYAADFVNAGLTNEEGLLSRNSYPVFDESTRRLSRIYNLITTRSDTFELYVTAQSGYLATADQNNDGAVDYRSDFVSTGEKKVRVVYER